MLLFNHQNPKLFGTLAKNVYQRWHLKHLIPLFFVLLYMLLGAVLFVWLEAAAERERIAERWAGRMVLTKIINMQEL
jgi:hypothetical protein